MPARLQTPNAVPARVMAPALACEVCHGDPVWRITRRGDAAVSWACDEDLDTVCHNLQRDWEITELVVQNSVKMREWATISGTLASIAEEQTPP